MTTRYQKRHYEDVARILLEFVLLSHVGPMTRDLVNTFADLFAADNPPFCSDCGDEKGTTSICTHSCGSHHVFIRGFDREQFLAACGLESEG